MKHRNLRVRNLIEAELGKIILREMEFPELLATITDVHVDGRIENAVVYVSVLPSEKSDAALKALNKNLPHLQYLLMKKINIKPMPKVSFKVDRGAENAAQVEKTLLDK